jgi:dihydrofolate reductase
MGTLMLTMHTTADGFVATEDGNLWPSFGWPEEAQAMLNDVYRQASAVIYGRKIYEMVVPFWTKIHRQGLPEGWPMGPVDEEFSHIMAPLPKYVVSSQFEPGDANTQVIRDNVVERVREITATAKGSVLLLAGGDLAGQLAAGGVLQEIFLMVGPIMLGRGRPLLAMDKPLPTRLLRAEPLPPKCTVMRYQITSEFPSER